MGRVLDYTVFPLLLLPILFWLAAAQLLSFVAPLLLLPLHVALAARLRAALPHLPPRGALARARFELAHTAGVVRRFLTLPLRRRAPDFVLVGGPEAGTAALAAYLQVERAALGRVLECEPQGRRAPHSQAHS